jgi:hypothetical protein
MFRASFRKVSNAASLLAVRGYKKTIEQLAKEV